MTVGGDSRRLSALYVLRQIALHAQTDQLYKIRGGMDQVPRAMARSLGEAVQYNAAVTRLDLGRRGVEVRYLDHRTLKTALFARVIVTLPFSELRRIEVHPRWPKGNASAIMDLPYAPAVRFLLQVKSRFWEGLELSGSARTDHPAETWDCTYDVPRDRGILGATASGAISDRVAYMSPPAAVQAGVDLVTDVFSGMRAEFEKGTAIRWAQEPWSRGAFAVFRPGQMASMMPAIARPEDGLHFAGEHTSPWMGWMEGALESGERAAREVLAAEAGTAAQE
jgi:monoamine oxidase